MDIKEMIQMIIDNGSIQDMHTLSHILVEVMEIIKSYDEDCYKKYEMELYKMAYGKTLSKSMAEDIVSNMRPYGEHWNMQETKRLQEQRGINDISDVDFFIVMNSAYNDFNNIFGEDTEGYIRYTIDFIKDEDAEDGKVFIYFTQIPR